MDHGIDHIETDIENDDSKINISDVIEVIQTDPTFKTPMYSGGGPVNHRPGPAPGPSRPAPFADANVEIIEQPASKALRFRYECEGRSAGSIPGASSTSENKTYPAIRVNNYRGKAVVVVSCVTKDEPYRAHPHNLVGREGCKRGVCTLEVPTETMTVTFQNLGIQCVKKRDIEEALRHREEIRVDPYRQGFTHRNQPTSIDLNVVRLCFQVFLEGERTPGKFTVPLRPVVSVPIFDKKAMSDLVICKLSDCCCSVAGGKEIILLCEKVAKEDIQVRFYEENNCQVVWEGYADFQPSHVHKQVAIAFRTPKYHRLDVSDSVKVFIQLRRPSDGATSESLPFELLPLDSGRPPFWSLRKTLKKGDYNTFSSILEADARTLTKNRAKNKINNLFSTENKIDEVKYNKSEVMSNIAKPNLKNNFYTIENKINEQNGNISPNIYIFDDEPTLKEVLENTKQVLQTTKQVLSDCDDVEIISEYKNDEPPKKDWCDYSELPKVDAKNMNNEKSLNDLLNQVTELDEIYSDTQARLLLLTDDKTESAQNIEMEVSNIDDAYSSLQMAFKNPIDMQYDIINIQGPLIDITSLKREGESEKLPPFPPKRIKKMSLSNINSPENIGDIKRSNSFNNLTAPSKKLPPTPTSTLPNPKKTGFFSKLFSKKNKKSKNDNDISESNTELNISQKDIVISLKGSESELRLDEKSDINDNDEVINLDLTDAEHYALYTAMAPHATQSEFDELSCYYSPVEGGKILLPTEVKSTNS